MARSYGNVKLCFDVSDKHNLFVILLYTTIIVLNIAVFA